MNETASSEYFDLIEQSTPITIDQIIFELRCEALLRREKKKREKKEHEQNIENRYIILKSKSKSFDNIFNELAYIHNQKQKEAKKRELVKSKSTDDISNQEKVKCLRRTFSFNAIDKLTSEPIELKRPLKRLIKSKSIDNSSLPIQVNYFLIFLLIEIIITYIYNRSKLQLKNKSAILI